MMMEKPAKARKTRHGDTPAGSQTRVAARKRGDDQDAMDVDELTSQEEPPTDATSDDVRANGNNDSNTQNESEMGIIEEIYCENFMCHRKMRVSLVR